MVIEGSGDFRPQTHSGRTHAASDSGYELHSFRVRTQERLRNTLAAFGAAVSIGLTLVAATDKQPLTDLWKIFVPAAAVTALIAAPAHASMRREQWEADCDWNGYPDGPHAPYY